MYAYSKVYDSNKILYIGDCAIQTLPNQSNRL